MVFNNIQECGYVRTKEDKSGYPGSRTQDPPDGRTVRNIWCMQTLNMDTVIDVTATHARTIGGYTRAQRVAIAGANVVTLKYKVIKKLLLPPISTQHWITSFNPEELWNNETNFFFLLVISKNKRNQSTSICDPSICIMHSCLFKWVVVRDKMLVYCSVN